MIVNSDTVQLIRQNAARLAAAVGSKEDLAELATAGSFEQVFSAIEELLTNTEMYFDDELLSLLDEDSWKNFKATLLVYTLNMVNRFSSTMRAQQHEGRSIHGASSEASF
jgi:hypothetical protein